ncbi:pectate lyase [Vulcaniibacterium tengchongense]|uniref:PelA/Pel-15E family pectate lyase n=1 Tax=Vulcaniibacterium tengchongense TaxID=1273429 RepID=A0A3N4V0G8_9GAMM|nr:pectate lyase [Vulcaniibacterium tengchongense]RPE75928.1 PelA/Pel-15E family pectate lyase [Vulcaniibacterium tengchongense]
MSRVAAALGALLAAATAHAQAPRHAAEPGAGAIPLDGFADAVAHWQNRHGADYPRYAPQQVREIADNLLLLQRESGGWPENRDPARVLGAAERERLRAERALPGGSFDNRNTYTQIDYLAAAHARTGEARYRDAALRGLDFVLARQLERCGGWPHTVPASQPYHPHITIADEVTPGVLAMLRRAAAFPFVDPARRQRIEAAVARGDACLLRLQVRQDGRLAGWAGQYDARTLQPAQGRRFELPALVSDETVSVLRYLMSIPQPSPPVTAAIEGGVDWLRRVALRGQRLETFPAPHERWAYHAADFDRRLVADPQAPPLWARFYDLRDNSVVLASRDGERLRDYAQIPRERRTGYHWFGTWPQALLERDYPAWKARTGAGAKPHPPR